MQCMNEVKTMLGDRFFLKNRVRSTDNEHPTLKPVAIITIIFIKM